MRFLADMPISRSVVEWLRAAGHDATHLRDEGLQRLPNGAIVQKAIAEQRVVLTADLDFGEILAATSGRAASIILFRLRNTRSPFIIERLKEVLRQSSQELSDGAVVVVEDARHRVRRLPIGR